MNSSILDIPGYKIEKLIAEGGMASVYLAQQESLARPVALKLLRKFDNESQALRFFNEGRIIASLEHRNIITIYDLGVAHERHYLAMEYLQGGDLRMRIKSGLIPSEALELLETLASCLSFVHQKGIIHRDIKPENILFRQDGTVVLTDFGVAKQLEANSALTMDGITLGSPHYLSPEQAECKPLDGRADIYSLGIVFYEMLTGVKPFQGDSTMEIIVAHLTSERPLLPPPLRRYYQPLLTRMMARNPADRFASAEELVEHVRHLRSSSTRKYSSLKTATPPSDTARPADAITKTLAEPVTGLNIAPASKAKLFKLAATAAGLSAALALLITFALQPDAPRISEQTLPARITTPAPQTALAPDITTPAEPAPDAHNAPAQAAAVSPPETEPQFSVAEPAAPAPPIVESKPVPDVKTALRQAAAILTDRHLTIPKLKQAYDLYQLTLKSNPRRPEALRGANIIANKFIAIKSEIQRNLTLANSAIKHGRLSAPEKNNAADYYRHILELEPGHEAALQGLDKLAGLYAERGEAELSKSAIAEAERNLQLGLSLQADHPRLQALAASLKQAAGADPNAAPSP